MKIFILLSVHFICSCADSFVKPDWMKTCYFSQPEFTKCSTSSIRGMFDAAFQGKVKIPGHESFEPWKIDKLKVFQGEGPVAVNANLSKVKIAGFSKIILIENQVSSKDYSWVTTIKAPHLRIDANYQMNGRVLLIPLNGKGKCWFEITNLRGKMFTRNSLFAKQGHTFYNVTDCKVNFDMEKVKFRMENLIPGAKSLNDGVNQFLNDNWRVASDAIKPIITSTVESIMLDLMGGFFREFPGDFLVGDLPRPETLPSEADIKKT